MVLAVRRKLVRWLWSQHCAIWAFLVTLYRRTVLSRLAGTHCRFQQKNISIDLHHADSAVTSPPVHFGPQPAKPFVPLFCYTVPYGTHRPWRTHCDSLEAGTDVAPRWPSDGAGVDTCGSDLNVPMLVLANNGSCRRLYGPIWIYLH